jgi:hypothetical protein
MIETHRPFSVLRHFVAARMGVDGLSRLAALMQRESSEQNGTSTLARPLKRMETRRLWLSPIPLQPK